ncbi:DsbA family protein [Mesorhizobium sp. M2C.T.Ca.TU.002.02.1.1]|uniref:DsbA family protein n=1 Tax=Mesorhizobium sp. M2C.T.Ca.TU.002.02.1.1 TaxID=2496788 RepID=UPI000FCB9CEC|nr:DsbA family protein [Mesorhizobium sp. M2C.T.Ca.TU.002.02.1.1]RUU54874.1 DsbA family protein [Mesorhizobium sp. M2C.T.Ca.TU.002.02.1.1]RUU71980.1 DsbA family protein [Mesorhizobium sp. M2C.T.Ca.TU.009.01.2.1]
MLNENPIGRRRFLLGASTLAASAALSFLPARAQEGLTPEQVLNDPDMPFVGAKNPDITIAEFMDYNCPYCRKSHPELKKLLASDRKVRVVYKDWPVFGPVSEYAARLAIAAKWQGKYEAAHDALMSSPKRFQQNKEVTAVLTKAGIDMAKLDKDAVAHKADIDKLIARNALQADTIGLQGTPSWLVESFIVFGGLSHAQLQEAVAEARRRKKAAAGK